MWEIPLFAKFIFVLLPLIVVIVVVLKIGKIVESLAEGINPIQIISLIPYTFIIYYLWRYMTIWLSKDALGYSGGSFQPINVVSHLTDAVVFLMEEAMPTCMAMILIWGILSIVSHHIEVEGGWT